MRKEILFAVVVGLIIAFIITVAFNRAGEALKKTPEPSPSATPSSSISPTTEQEILVIHSPEDGIIQEEKQVLVAGTTLPNTPLVLLANDNDYITISDATGSFSFTPTLKEGGNILQIYVLKEDGSSLSVERSVLVGNFSSLLEGGE